jgi:hypothetical protein
MEEKYGARGLRSIVEFPLPTKTATGRSATSESMLRGDFEVVGVFKETLSGIRRAKGKQPVERKSVMDFSQRREIDAVLVMEMTR